MNLVCPTCNLTRSRPYRAVRLEVCERCERDGRTTYLVAPTAPKRRTRPEPANPRSESSRT